MKTENKFNKHASELVVHSNVLSRLKGRQLWCSPDSRTLAAASLDAIKVSIGAIESELERASKGDQR